MTQEELDRERVIWMGVEVTAGISCSTAAALYLTGCIPKDMLLPVIMLAVLPPLGLVCLGRGRMAYLRDGTDESLGTYRAGIGACVISFVIVLLYLAGIR
jgi:hypothetical protein